MSIAFTANPTRNRRTRAERMHSFVLTDMLKYFWLLFSSSSAPDLTASVFFRDGCLPLRAVPAGARVRWHPSATY
jgi:hypothetical protein